VHGLLIPLSAVFARHGVRNSALPAPQLWRIVLPKRDPFAAQWLRWACRATGGGAWRVRRGIVFGIQVVLVVGLFAAAVALIWRAGASAVARDQRRARALKDLAETEEALARVGAFGLMLVPAWPESLAPGEWEALDGWLSERASAVLADRPGRDGGFYAPEPGRFLGRGTVAGPGTTAGQRSAPPQRVRALVAAQIQQALDQDRSVAMLVEVPPRCLALRVAPLWVNGRRVAATWVVEEIDEGDAMAASLADYRLSAGLALAGVVSAMLVAVGLAWTVRRQARERARLDDELHRSERLAALGRLLAGVAHEVRNPLAGIRATAQLCRRGLALDTDAAADLIDEVDRLDAIVGRLLQFSRAQAERRVMASLNDLAQEAARLAQPAADAQGVLVQLDLGPNLPPAEVSPAGIVQVLRNLTNNALQAMPEGGRLRLATRFDPARRTVCVEVADTGPGLSPEARAHLFEPFYTTRPEGTGLGLAIAREIALAHRGTLRAVVRRVEPGAAFVLELPTAPGAGRAEAPEAGVLAGSRTGG
jgi:two-component system sensor histidine kinase HydH